MQSAMSFLLCFLSFFLAAHPPTHPPAYLPVCHPAFLQFPAIPSVHPSSTCLSVRLSVRLLTFDGGEIHRAAPWRAGQGRGSQSAATLSSAGASIGPSSRPSRLGTLTAAFRPGESEGHWGDSQPTHPPPPPPPHLFPRF